MVHPEVEKAKRRDFGKLVNNSMLFGLSAHGLQRHVQDVFDQDPGIESASSVWDAWWGRYVSLRAFREWVQAVVRQAQVEGRALVIEAPSGRKSRFSKVEVLGGVGKGRREKGPDGAWRTIFSAIFRGVEGDLLLMAAPMGRETAVWTALEAAGALAAREIGVVGLVMVRK
ncbi:MAG: hypothetical protein JRI25_10265 [Deltaproteobacteria bacterium]|nr:hypothetical protein [Deltaproteobacteria bacterium]